MTEDDVEFDHEDYDGDRTRIRVRGPSAPQSQWILTAEFRLRDSNRASVARAARSAQAGSRTPSSAATRYRVSIRAAHQPGPSPSPQTTGMTARSRRAGRACVTAISYNRSGCESQAHLGDVIGFDEIGLGRGAYLCNGGARS